MQKTEETWILSPGWEDPLEEEMATHSSILAWRIPWRKKPGRVQPMGSQRVRHDWARMHTGHSLSDGRRKSHCDRKSQLQNTGTAIILIIKAMMHLRKTSIYFQTVRMFMMGPLPIQLYRFWRSQMNCSKPSHNGLHNCKQLLTPMTFIVLKRYLYLIMSGLPWTNSMLLLLR